MNLAEEAISELNIEENRKVFVKYSGKFKSLNANVKYDNKTMVYSLSKEWKEYSDSIRKGLIQSLACKVYKINVKTLEIDLYEKFINNVGKYAKREKTEPLLDESFNRVNKEYFEGFMEKPNLVWGQNAFRKLGHYEHQTDTVLVSNIFKKDEELLDYIMYHELLHKKHGLKRTRNGRNIHHSKEFKEDERKFKNKNVENKLKWFVRKNKLKNAFGF